MNEFDAVKNMIEGLSPSTREKILKRYEEFVLKVAPSDEDYKHWIGKASFNVAVGMKVLVGLDEKGKPKKVITNEDVEVASVNTNMWLSEVLDDRASTEEKIIMTVAFLTAAACNCIMLANALGAPIDGLLEFFIARLAKDVKGLEGHVQTEGTDGGRPWESGGDSARQKEEQTDKIMFG